MVGEPLTNWRLVPLAVKVRLSTSWCSSHGSSPFSSRNCCKDDGARRFVHVENGLHRTTLLATADEGAVGAFAEDKVERADNDGFAGAGFAGDDIASRLEFQREVGHQREVFNAQRRQHR